MTQVIGKKQCARNEDFVNAWENIEQLVSREEAEALVASAVSDILEKTKGKRAGYAWSGGKDSLALQYVCEKAGIKRCVIGLATDLEYVSFLNWIERHAPSGLVRWNNEKLTLGWLAKHPEMLFPSRSAESAKWFSLIQHRAQAWFFKKYNLDIICLGRRLQDGNYTGGAGQNIYTDRKGVTRFSPIAHWKHEQVLAVVHYFMNRNIPPIYDMPNGWIVGTGVWPARPAHQFLEDLKQDRWAEWEEMYTIAPQVVHGAALYFKSAKEYLNFKINNNGKN